MERIRNIVHRLIPILVCLVTVVACNDTLMDRMWKNNLENENQILSNAERIALLQARCDSINMNISSISYLANSIIQKDRLINVEKKESDGEDGWTLYFKSGKIIEIRNGKDGAATEAPVVGIKSGEDGHLYWTVNGEWLCSEDGSPLKVVGDDAVTPLLRQNEGKWEVSFNGGDSWMELGVADGKNGDELFSSVEIGTEEVIFTLADGSTFAIPLYKALSIWLDIASDETGIEARKTIMLNFRIEGGDENTVVTASSDGNYTVQIEKGSPNSGRIIITGPKYYEDGHITVIASANGYTVYRVVNFYKREIIFPDGLKYIIPAQGGQISVPVYSNYEFRLELPESAGEWLGIEGMTKASMEERSFTVNVGMNKEFEDRSATIELYAVNDPGNPLRKIEIFQTAAKWELQRIFLRLGCRATTARIALKSSFGLYIEPGIDDWISVSYFNEGFEDYTLEINIDGNEEGKERHGEINLFSEDGTQLLDVVKIEQVAEGEEDPETMIFKVRPLNAYDRTVTLPLNGNVDCIIEWGDGTPEERVNYEFPSHKYISSDETFIIRINGTVSSLSSGDRPGLVSVCEVIQWGHTGLRSMSEAFENNLLLEKIPSDGEGAFSEVYSFNEAFQNCKSLKEIPESLFAYADKLESAYNVFRNCTEIKEIPEKLLDKCKSLKDLGGMFASTNIEIIPDKLFYNCPELQSFNEVFSDCKKLRAIPRGMLRNNIHIKSFGNTFTGCSLLGPLPDDLFAYCPEANNFRQTFVYCNNMGELPPNLFDNNPNIDFFQEVFFGCGLTGESPYTIINGQKIHLYERHLYPDYFRIMKNYQGYMRGYVGNNFTDNDQIPDNWKH